MSSGKFLKRLSKSAAAGRIASFFASLYIRLVAATTRWTLFGAEEVTALAASRGVIFAFWHQRLLMMPTIRKLHKGRVAMLISAHRDGEIIADAVKGFGLEFVRGSTARAGRDKGGAGAILEMQKLIEAGVAVGVTPDGPRGPARYAQAGAVRLAAQTGAPIIPLAYAVSNGKFLNSWDRFLLALPFSKGVFMAGAPIAAPVDSAPETIETARHALQIALDDITARADAAVGLKSLDRAAPKDETR